jgi:hypothetical protein
MLRKRPEDRYQSYDEILRDLETRRGVGGGRAVVTLEGGAAPSPPAESKAGWRLSPVVIAVALLVAGVSLLLFSGGTGEEKAERPPPAERSPADSESSGRSRQPGALAPWIKGEYLTAALQTSTLAKLRQLANNVELFRVERGQLPSSLHEVAEALDLQPQDLLDGWERWITYETVAPESYRLRSAGPDGVRGSADDIVIEDLYVVQGQPTIPPL